MPRRALNCLSVVCTAAIISPAWGAFIAPRIRGGRLRCGAGKAEERGIYGEATPAEVKALVEDGVPVAALPPKPIGKDELN